MKIRPCFGCVSLPYVLQSWLSTRAVDQQSMGDFKKRHPYQFQVLLQLLHDDPEKERMCQFATLVIANPSHLVIRGSVALLKCLIETEVSSSGNTEILKRGPSKDVDVNSRPALLERASGCQ